MPPRVVNRLNHGQALSRRLDLLMREDVVEAAQDGEDEDLDDTRVVLKFKGSTRLAQGPFNGLKFTPLGEDSGWNYYVLGTLQARRLLADLLKEYMDVATGDLSVWDHPDTWAQLLDNIEDIELYGREDRVDAQLLGNFGDVPRTLDLLLWPASKPIEAQRRIDEIRALVVAAARQNPVCRVETFDPRPDQTLVRIVADQELFEILADLAVVERIRPPLQAEITLSDIVGAAIPEDLPKAGSQVIGIIDGLVNTTNPLTGPLLVESRVFPDAGNPGQPADRHGTAVAGIAAWGDLDPLITGQLTRMPHRIASAVVLTQTGNGRVEVSGIAHQTIEKAIRWLVEEHGTRVIGISINYEYPAASTPLREELTYTIDQLARELNIVIVVSAGNRQRLSSGHWLNDYPSYLRDDEAGVAPPGDAAIAVTVGSITRRDRPGGRFAASKVAISPAFAPSPFTRLGPTRGTSSAGVMKPEFYEHGGNWAWDHSGNSLDANEWGIATVVPVPMTTGRSLGVASGTSYAAPAVAHEIARIAERYPDSSANTLRALCALSARHYPPNLNGVDQLRVSAYGEPDADRILESSTQRVVLIYEGVIETNGIQVHNVPIPREFADGFSRRSFRVALAFDPPVRRRRREYIAGTMAIEFVRGLGYDEIERIYARQPSVSEVASNPTLERLALPAGDLRPPMIPNVRRLESNTLIRRNFDAGQWDPDHESYHILVTHNRSSWTAAQQRGYDVQTYSLAIEVADETRTSLDLYALMQNRLRLRARSRIQI